MPESFLCQGRVVQPADIPWLQSWINDHPSWSRYRLACELCKLWDWSTPTGQLKDFAARSFLLKLMARGLITLPPVRTEKQRVRGYASPISSPVLALQQPSAIASSLAELTPLSLIIPKSGSPEEHLCHHYLGFQRTVGENLKYVVRDRHGRDLACMLFGAAAWKTKPRDQFIGWTDAIRTRRLWRGGAQHPFSHLALGQSTSSGKPSAGHHHEKNQRRLATQIRASAPPDRNFCRT